MRIFSTVGFFLAVLLYNGTLLQSCLGSGSMSTIICIEEERQALLKFKQSLTDTTGWLSSWTGEDCCNWKGIQCDRNTSHVVKLDLVSIDPDTMTIESNEVNPSLLELKYLKHLDLSGNNFNYISIPIFFGSMTSLRYLNLSSSNFSGRVPHHLGNLSSLMVLDLNGIYHNWLNIDDFTWVSRLSSLQYLDVSGIDLSQALNLNEVLNMLPSLTDLRLSSCEIPRTILVSHFQLNSTASNIRKLDLSWNSFAGEFPKFIENLTALRVLDFSGNKLNSSFPFYLEHLKSLEHLNLDFNSFTDLLGLLRLLLTQCNLKSLDMSQNLFEGEMSRSYGNLSGCAMYNLEMLILSSNRITGALPNWLGQFKHLKYLDLQKNSFSHPIPNFFEKLELLTYLDLSLNSLSGSIPQSLGTLSALEALGISENELNGTIPVFLGQLSSLKFLDISENQLTGTIPVSLGQLSSLKLLDISENQLTGTIPVSLGQLSNLMTLDLSSNHLEGIVTEDHFSNLAMLEVLRIHSNFLTLKVISDWMPPFLVESLLMGSCKIGTGFPQWLQTQKKLSWLEISNASISGSLPQWLNEMPLMTLDLSENLISGPIKTLPSTLTQLYLSDNLITGPLPQNISEMLPSLEALLLDGNLISGLIPYSLWEIPALQILDLSKNRLFGNLPHYKGWGVLSALRVIRLSSNNLSGILPSSIGNFTFLEELQLNKNNFYGELPSTLRNCPILRVLDLGENGFSGSIPRWIGDLPLVILRLHQNMFIDKIPSQLCRMQRLQIMDFGYNHLSGPIPRCFGNLSGMILDEDGLRYNEYWIETSMMQVIKGRELEFTTTLELLANMDLSRNNLIGSIPKEITNLSGLRGLNLSHNHLTGNIPENISGLKSLESLDFSMNQLLGIIPQSISGLNSLSRLNLSYNNLSGRIPTGNQLQTLDDPSSSYLGNNELCGVPLPRNCPGDENSQPPTTTGPREEQEDDDLENFWFYMAIMSGYATGLWGVIGVLLLKKDWRYACFQFVETVNDKVLVAISLGVARLKNYINQFGG